MAQKGINKAIIIGNLGNDPDVKYTPSGSAVANISVATSETWKDKNSGEKQEKTEWHRIVFFGKLAEIAGEYLRKGAKVYIEGKLQTRKWQDKNGEDRYTTEVVADVMQMLGGEAKEPKEDKQKATNDFYQEASGGDFKDFDDDIPFMAHERFTVA